MDSSRKKNSTRNLVVSLASYVLYTLLSFALRSVFIKTLGETYLGISGLFSNVLTLLSFAELGIAQVIAFHLYKPIAQDDREKIASLMQLYKTAYAVIGSFVIVVGFAVIPFFGSIIKSEPDIPENLIVIYLFYLFNTGVSYFIAYKQTLISAAQKSYIISAYGIVFKFLRVIFQVWVLLEFRSFYAYLSVQFVLMMIENIILASRANRLYPEIKGKKIKKLSKKEQKEVFSGVGALLIYKIGSAVMNGTDNIIITRLISLEAVGFSDNYRMIITAISAVVDQIPKAVTASIGNLNATADKEKKYSVFKTMVFICGWVYGFCASGMFAFGSEFIELVFGTEWMIEPITVFALASTFYISSFHSPTATYRMTSGSFVHGRYVAVISSVMNIALSIFLGKLMGLSGVFFATTITRIFSYGIVDAHVLYKYIFERKVREYGTMSVICFVAAGVSYFIGYLAIRYISLSGVFGFAVRLAVYTVVFNGVYLLFVFKTPQFNEVRSIVVNDILKKFFPSKL